MDMASFIALLFAKNMALLPLGEPKIGTENDLAPRARKKRFTRNFWKLTHPSKGGCSRRGSTLTQRKVRMAAPGAELFIGRLAANKKQD